VEAKLNAEVDARAKLEAERKKAEDDKAAEEEKKKADKAIKDQILAEAKANAEEALKKQEKAPIKFKDAVGRKFSFPYHLCATWQGMEELIKQAFIHVDVIGPHVQEGHYDLIGPNAEIILPSVWEKVVEPDWAITMHMWPMDRIPLRGQPPPGHPGGPIPVGGRHHIDPRMMRPMPGGMRPPGVRPAGAAAGMRHHPPAPPPPGGWQGGMPQPGGPRAPANVVTVDPEARAKKKKSKEKAPTVFRAFMNGGSTRRSSSRRYGE